ncbi:MAG TPA: esterase [Leptospiraceae bacterium]|nr:esterase [Leptospiraceae bacterium]HMY66948.1 esterase [Leptospiraceae bacterium]HNF15558.1 esterase [Leptospiraceae bacterium]HNF28082.1 esterase [Leptospiraceae bacterium]HNH11397.1 esterase [Leptospiraceae bacterium]
MESFKRTADIEALQVPGDKDGLAVILIHGFGANAMDLYPLKNYIQLPKGTNWYFPNGIQDVPISPQYSGKAWFPIGISTLLQDGDFSKVAEYEPPGLNEAFNKMDAFIRALPHPYEKIILGGFSQGAMLSTELFLRREERPHSLILMSGTLLNTNRWKKAAEKKKGYQFFQSHGTNDPLLPFSAAKKLESIFREAGLIGEFVQFQGGHEIPEQVLKRASAYLKR